ncbi:hypothetical protein MBAV_005135 [Candidatus Magnetobacterium bavaricum]|uniref:Uncharacterized protein n=1 Tax=Candidatus Magnetobacterium bavaricum TaxID=29290 RepID=A0A0F3GL75_9BACT|nr:hypothetical protein MBAV_005135 [Candidatus Magnetobacterium bavaricum]
MEDNLNKEPYIRSEMAPDLRERDIQALRSKLLMHKQQLLAEAEATLTAIPDTSMFPDLGDG